MINRKGGYRPPFFCQKRYFIMFYSIEKVRTVALRLETVNETR